MMVSPKELRRYAGLVLRMHIYTGRMVSAKALDTDCVDCGLTAKCYDHRNYINPLDVVPVRHACNFKRGQGVPLLSDPDIEVDWIDAFNTALDACATKKELA